MALAIVIERFIALRPSVISSADLTDTILLKTKNKKLDVAELKTWETSSALGFVLSQGLKYAHEKPDCKEDELVAALENAGRICIAAMEKHLSTLGTIASVAPLLGLLGTVVGMIEIFGSQGAGAIAANPAQLAHGISIALYNTAAGLGVAIPSLIFWRYFRNRVDAYVSQLEQASFRLVTTIRIAQN